jgi:hypothetical protein
MPALPVRLLSSSCLLRARGRLKRDINTTAPVQSFAPDTGWPALEGHMYDTHPDHVRSLTSMSGADVREPAVDTVRGRGCCLESVRGDACG